VNGTVLTAIPEDKRRFNFAPSNVLGPRHNDGQVTVELALVMGF